MSEDDEQRSDPRLRTDQPHVARVYDYLLGGKNNYPADRAVGDAIIAAMPDNPATVRANRDFLARAVHLLAADLGMRQFLDIGTGLPSENNTHEVAQRAAPDSRIVYVDNDPLVLVHAEALLTSTPEGRTWYLEADLNDPENIVRLAAERLDFSQPVVLMLVGILHCILDDARAAEIVRQLTARMPEGSYLVLSHPCTDISSRMSDVAEAFNNAVPEDVRFRVREQILPFFEGWELLEPGMVSVSQWRPGVDVNPTPRPVWGAVARKL